MVHFIFVCHGRELTLNAVLMALGSQSWLRGIGESELIPQSALLPRKVKTDWEGGRREGDFSNPRAKSSSFFGKKAVGYVSAERRRKKILSQNVLVLVSSAFV